MKVVSYIRVSGAGQIDKDGPDRQRDALIKFCRAYNLQHSGEFFEQGVSGTVEAIERPEFAEMLLFIARHKGGVNEIEGIVVENMTRLARDLMVSEFLLAECRKRGIKVFTADSGNLVDMATDGGDPTRVMLRQILGAVSQWEKSMLVLKLRSARDRKRASGGKCEGRYHFGALPEEQETLRMIADMNERQKLSYAAIAEILNIKHRPSATGRPWTLDSVYNVFKQRRLKRRKVSDGASASCSG